MRIAIGSYGVVKEIILRAATKRLHGPLHTKLDQEITTYHSHEAFSDYVVSEVHT